MAKRIIRMVTGDFSRFIKYFVAGVFFFVFDLSLFWVFVNISVMQYILATVLAFFIANSLNYFVNRLWGFQDTKVSRRKGYFSYMGAACLALAIITLFMLLFVQILGVNLFFARAIVGSLVGIGNYVINHLYTFKIPFLEED